MCWGKKIGSTCLSSTRRRKPPVAVVPRRLRRHEEIKRRLFELTARAHRGARRARFAGASGQVSGAGALNRAMSIASGSRRQVTT
jgi:hypothetical protein